MLTTLESEVSFSLISYFSDFKVALYLIKGILKEWKPFAQNHINEIRRLVVIDYWHHCPSKENPSDIPLRGMAPSELSGNILWRHEPSWLVV